MHGLDPRPAVASFPAMTIGCRRLAAEHSKPLADVPRRTERAFSPESYKLRGELLSSRQHGVQRPADHPGAVGAVVRFERAAGEITFVRSYFN